MKNCIPYFAVLENLYNNLKIIAIAITVIKIISQLAITKLLIFIITTVTVGSVEHPMVPEHFIGWIAIKTNKGEQKKFLQAGEKPEAVFVLAEGEELIETYEYCNLHGLWKK